MRKSAFEENMIYTIHGFIHQIQQAASHTALLQVRDMSWIREIDHDDAKGELKDIYDELREKRGKVANILKVQSLLPGSMKRHMDLYLTIMFSSSGIKREDRELIAVIVSAENGCEYCLNHHREALNHYWKDDSKVERVIADPTHTDLTERQMRMIGYARKLTLQPQAVTEKDIEYLRASGLSDNDLLLIGLITSYFNFVNRMALGLGVEFTPEEVSGYKY